MINRIKNLFNRNSQKIKIKNVSLPVPDEGEEGLIRIFSRHPLMITIHYAHGGIILHTKQWDKKQQEYDHTNYVIHDDEEISKTIEKIIFLNSLKQ